MTPHVARPSPDDDPHAHGEVSPAARMAAVAVFLICAALLGPALTVLLLELLPIRAVVYPNAPMLIAVTLAMALAVGVSGYAAWWVLERGRRGEAARPAPASRTDPPPRPPESR